MSSLLDFIIGKKLYKEKNIQKKKIYLFTSIGFNIGLLLIFKYCNFFIDSFATLLEIFNFNPNYSSLNIILPVGISFYTFQTLSYSIDIYNEG